MKLINGSRPVAGTSGNLRKPAFLIILLLAIQPCLCQTEPVLKIQVISEDSSITLDDGDTIQFHGKSVVIKTERVKTFNLEGLRFEYPRDYAYKYEEAPEFRSWILDGNNFVIMLFEFSDKSDLSRVTKEMVRKFGKKNCTVEDKKIVLNNVTLKGKRINVNLFGASLTFDMFPLPLTQNKTHIIAFQDTKTIAGNSSSEGTETMSVINSSLEIR